MIDQTIPPRRSLAEGEFDKLTREEKLLYASRLVRERTNEMRVTARRHTDPTADPPRTVNDP
jgi:hypothetical protein